MIKGEKVDTTQRTRGETAFLFLLILMIISNYMTAGPFKGSPAVIGILESGVVK
jgi:hypothetical protein